MAAVVEGSGGDTEVLRGGTEGGGERGTKGSGAEGCTGGWDG